MKKSKILLLFALSFLASVTLLCQVPVIISQPTTVNVCEGDSITLEVIADSVYNLQWFTAVKNVNGFYNYAEIPGEVFYKLTRNPVLLSLQPGNLYYFLRLISQTDTVWSAEIRINIFSLNKPIGDTIQVNKLPGHIRIPMPFLFAPLIWSTGDTTEYPPERDYVEFEHLGKHWVTTNKSGCSRTDTFQVVLCPAVIHIDTSSNKTQCWCADTVYIDNDVNMPGGVVILPGTTVKLTGNYMFDADYIDAYGVERDSIYILGNRDPLLHTHQGSLIVSNAYSYSGGPGNNCKNLVIKNMQSVSMFRAGSPKFLENDHIQLYDANNCIFGYNKEVIIGYSMQNCLVLGNDSVFGVLNSLPKGGPRYFYCYHNIFKSNHTGFVIQDEEGYHYNSGPVHVWNNIFEDNKSAAITLKTFMNYIDQNIFINNTSQTGPPVMMGDFKKVVRENINYGYGLTFRNNTLYNNTGKNCNGITIRDSSDFSMIINNNIFWNRRAENTVDILTNNPIESMSRISNNSFRGDETCLILPADTNFQIVNNLYNTYPGFSDTLNALLTLKESSPVIDKGIDITHDPGFVDFFFSTDLNGFPRKIGNAVDIGAYEYHPAAPLAFSYVTPDTMACNGDSITLKVMPEGGYRDDLYTYDWYKDGNIIQHVDYQNIFYLDPASLSAAGTYQAAVSNGTDTLWSRPIHLFIPRVPVINEQPVSQQVCKGMNVNFEFWAPNSQQFQYSWYSTNYGQLPSTSHTCNINNVTENDTLYVTASNHCGSDTSEPILLIVSPVPEPGLGIDTCINAADSILLDAGPAIRYTWNTGEHEKKIFAYAGDTVWVLATNVYFCTGSDTIAIFSVPVAGELSIMDDPAFMFYPNPSKDKLFLRIAENTDLPCRISIISRDGKLITETEIHSREEQVIDVSTFGKGIYFIRLQSASTSGIGKFIVL